MQLFVKRLDGVSAVVHISSDALASHLKEIVQGSWGVPVAAQVLVCSSGVLHDTQTLLSQGVSEDSTICVTSRLLGGKGGFGALLRGQKRDGTITSNYDACRDLSGRRIRYQTTEEKMKKWQEEEKEREMEQLALKHLKEQAKKERREQQSQVDVEAVRTEQQAAVEQVQDAVQAALASAANGNSSAAASGASSKHKLGPAAAAGPSKRPKMLAMLESGFTDSEDDSEDEDGDADADAADDAGQQDDGAAAVKAT